ncbi:MAG: protein kinase, partial [Planctomycetota bacterium]
PIRVLKIGGSLLTHPELPRRLNDWLDQQPPAVNAAIIGGGELIDAMRRLDRLSPIEPAALHWQCVDLLQITYRWFAGQLDDWQKVCIHETFEARFQVASQASAEARILVAVESFYRPEPAEAPAIRCKMPRLPTTWATTTDAIAGGLAICLGAAELVLFKSCPVATGATLAELAQAGVVDEALPLLQESLPAIRFVNLRA